MKGLYRANDIIKAVDKHMLDDGSLDDDISCILEEIKPVEDTKIIHDCYFEVPLETLYLEQFINDLLVRYNTVSIQKSKDYYMIKVDRPL